MSDRDPIAEGDWSIFVIQHQWKKEGDWADSNLGSFLINAGATGTKLENLLRPYHSCWQSTSFNGFFYRADAEAVLFVLASSDVDKVKQHNYRIALKVISKHTSAVITGKELLAELKPEFPEVITAYHRGTSTLPKLGPGEKVIDGQIYYSDAWL